MKLIFAAFIRREDDCRQCGLCCKLWSCLLVAVAASGVDSKLNSDWPQVLKRWSPGTASTTSPRRLTIYFSYLLALFRTQTDVWWAVMFVCCVSRTLFQFAKFRFYFDTRLCAYTKTNDIQTEILRLGLHSAAGEWWSRENWRHMICSLMHTDDVDNDVNDDDVILDVLNRVADWTSAGQRRRHDAIGRNFSNKDDR